MASGYDGHVSKRQRTDGDDYWMSSDDRHRTEPSPVVHIRGLNDTVTERHLEEALRRFGTISFVMMIPRKHMALVEFEELEAATRCVEYSQTAPINVNGGPAFLNYSNSKKIQRPRPNEGNGPEHVNRVLLFTVQNPQHPITVDVLHTICSPSGRVLRIVIFKKHGVQCMVEFDSAEGAIRCKDALCGADIYSGCCTLKIEFARPTALNVTRNDSESWDYTGSLGMKPEAASPRQAPLLAEPRYGSAPIAYGQYAAEGSTTPRGTGGYSDYGADTYGGGDPYRPAPQERGYGQHPPAVFAAFELPNPSKIKKFPAKSDRSSTGLVEWENKNDSIDALSAANHMEMENPSGKRPYILKLCFPNTPIRK